MVMFEISILSAHPPPGPVLPRRSGGVVAGTSKFGPRGKVGICISARRSDAVRLHL